ncbi:heavy metal translocating P-type ATPase, partial [Aquaticitalea lipolytica]|uniref:heavy-metal-associated domain-containing protein n=1 Tax=Aquaticitalea lipolytica TaxID=1247562 RepID=UPI003D2EA9F6
MKKLQLKIPIILPQVPNEQDTCVERLIKELQAKEGIEKVHVADAKEDDTPQLCFHYDPDIISIDRIQSFAERTGAEITEKYGHLLIEVKGIRHTRHARTIEKSLLAINGVLEASASASGMVRLEFDKKQTNFDEISKQIEKEDLQVQRSSSNENNHTIVSKKKQERPKKEDAKEQTSTEGHEHKEGETHEDGEAHAHGGIFGKNTELIFSIICGALLGIGFGLSYVESIPDWVSLTLYIGAYFFGGFFTAKEAVQTVVKGGFEIDFLMLVAAIGAAILGEWAEGALLLFLFSLGHALEHYAMNKARKSIAALADLAPKTALLKKDGKTEEVGIEQLSIGDIIVVKPNSKISADGVVVNGKSSVNQAPITGESVPVDKLPVEDITKDYSADDDIKDDNRVFAGTINGNNTLEIKVIKEAKDSTLSRLV